MAGEVQKQMTQKELDHLRDWALAELGDCSLPITGIRIVAIEVLRLISDYDLVHPTIAYTGLGLVPAGVWELL
jgi:hypothetical protein